MKTGLDKVTSNNKQSEARKPYPWAKGFRNSKGKWVYHPYTLQK